MKQTNSAITMLLGSFRSIFKRAYFKGIASAVVLTAGLAAGAAQASISPELSDSYAQSNSPVVVSGSETIHLSSEKWANGGLTLQSGADVTVTANGTTLAVAGDMNLQSGSSLTVSSASGAIQIVGTNTPFSGTSTTVANNFIANKAEITLSGSDATGVSVSFATIDINGGSLTLSGKDSNIWAYGSPYSFEEDDAGADNPDNDLTDANVDITGTDITLYGSTYIGAKNAVTIDGKSTITVSGSHVVGHISAGAAGDDGGVFISGSSIELTNGNVLAIDSKQGDGDVVLRDVTIGGEDNNGQVAINGNAIVEGKLTITGENSNGTDVTLVGLTEDNYNFDNNDASFTSDLTSKQADITINDASVGFADITLNGGSVTLKGASGSDSTGLASLIAYGKGMTLNLDETNADKSSFTATDTDITMQGYSVIRTWNNMSFSGGSIDASGTNNTIQVNRSNKSGGGVSFSDVDINVHGNLTISSTYYDADTPNISITNSNVVIDEGAALTIGSSSSRIGGNNLYRSNIEVTGGTINNAGTLTINPGLADFTGVTSFANTGTINVIGSGSAADNNFAVKTVSDLVEDSGNISLTASTATDAVTLTVTGADKFDVSKTADFTLTGSGSFYLDAVNSIVTVGENNSNFTDVTVDEFIGQTTTSGAYTIASGDAVHAISSVDLSSDNSGDKTLTVSGALTLGSNADGSVTAETGDFNGIDLVVDHTDAEVNFAHGTWADVGDVDVQTGALSVGETASVSVGELTTTASGKVTVEGTLNVAGGDSGAVSIASGSVTINNGATVSLGSAVAANIEVSGSNITASGGVAENAFNVSGGTLKIDFADTETFDADNLKALKEHVFGTGYDSGSDVINGYLNIGAAEIKGIDVSDDGEISMDAITSGGASGVVGSGVTNTELSTANVTGVAADDVASGQFGSLTADANNSDTSLKAAGNLQLNGAKGNNSAADNNNYVQNADGDVLGLSSDSDRTNVTLAGDGGNVGDISLTGDNSSFTTAASNTVNIQGSVTVSGDVVFDGATEVEGDVTSSADVELAASTTIGGNVSAKNVNVSNASSIDGDVTATDSVELAASTTIGGDISAAKGVAITAATTVGGTSIDAGDKLELSSVLTLTNEDTVAVKAKSADIAGGTIVSDKAELIFGDSGSATSTTIEGVSVIDVASITFTAGTGTNTNTININGSSVVTADTLTGASGAVINVGTDGVEGDASTSSTGTLIAGSLSLNGATLTVDPIYGIDYAAGIFKELTDGTTVGTLDGNFAIGKNSVIAVGDFEDRGDLTAFLAENGLMGDNGSLTEELGSLLVVDDTLTIGSGAGISIDGTATQSVTANTISLGEHSAIVLTEGAFGGRDDAAGELEGDYAISFVNQDGASSSGSGSVVVDGGKVLLAGTFYVSDFADGTKQIFTADDGSGNGGSVSVVDDAGADSTIAVESTNGLVVGTIGADGRISNIGIKTDKVDSVLNRASAPVKSLIVTAMEGVDVDKTDLGTKFLSYAGFNTNGQDAESAARMAVYGGAVQAALMAQQTTTDAISERMDLANPNGSLIYADNAQGGGLWLAPVYKNHDSDSFDAQGVDYGADIDLYGVALGADFTTDSGVRVGALFNVGSGDADGQGVGEKISNDFDYYGFGLYAGVTFGQFALTADAGFTQVSNDLEQNVAYAGKLTADTDTSAATVGLKASYKFETAFVDVTPHVGVRYTMLDMDSYDVKSAEGVLASTDADSMKIFSIPFGVTVAKDFTAGAWQIKPVFDLTLTANAGDDELDTDTSFSGMGMSTALSTEVLDSFTYGGTLGINAKYADSLSIGLNVNYTGSDNADEFGVVGNIRYMF